VKPDLASQLMDHRYEWHITHVRRTHERSRVDTFENRIEPAAIRLPKPPGFLINPETRTSPHDVYAVAFVVGRESVHGATEHRYVMTLFDPFFSDAMGPDFGPAGARMRPISPIHDKYSQAIPPGGRPTRRYPNAAIGRD